MKTKIEQLRSWIAESKRMVFFGGAGVRRNAAFRISAVQTACTTRNSTTRRRRS